MPETRDEADRTELRITGEEARRVAALLRYAISLNTTVGLVSPTLRRLATSTSRSAERAALILEVKTFEEAVEEDHNHALALLQQNRDTLREAISGRMAPEQLAEYLEVQENQFLEMIKAKTAKKGSPEAPDG